MFSTQKQAGIDTVILQWTGAQMASGLVLTNYPSSPSTGFRTWDYMVPRLLASAQRKGVKVWLGLILKSSLFDEETTRGDIAVLNAVAKANGVIAADLLSKYRGQFAGWYIPTEPGLATVAYPDLTRLHLEFLHAVTTSLDQLDPSLPVMISPSVPRAIEASMSGVEFVERLAPLMQGSGIEVWNLQDGYKMTGWTPAQNRALIEKGQEIAALAGTEIWATIYTPGPGQANYPVTPTTFFADLDAVGATGARVTIWTYDAAMNPDPTRTNAAARQGLYDLYVARNH